MKAKRLVDGQIVNPFFSHEKRREAKASGQPYDVSPFLVLKAGEVVEDPDVWKLCLGANPVMAPVDDECKSAVLAAMSDPKRQQFLRQLKRMDAADVRKQMNKSQLEWIDEMMKAYGSEVNALDAEPAKARTPKQLA